MHTHRTWILVVLLVSVLSAPGCLWTPELSKVRNQLEDGLPGSDYRKQVELSLGPGLLTLARAITSVVRDEEFRRVRSCLRDVSRVQVAVYENHGDPVGDEPVQLPGRLRELVDDGWEMVARVNDGGDHVWLLCRADDDTIRDMLVVVMNDRDLVLVKARGRLNRAVERMLDENGIQDWKHRHAS